MKNKDTLRKIQYHGYNFRLRSQKKKKKKIILPRGYPREGCPEEF